jgi:hypothetical protein
VIFLDDALTRLRGEKREIEQRIDEGYDPHLSRQLDRIIVAIEALELYVRERRAA